MFSLRGHCVSEGEVPLPPPPPQGGHHQYQPFSQSEVKLLYIAACSVIHRSGDLRPDSKPQEAGDEGARVVWPKMKDLTISKRGKEKKEGGGGVWSKK